MLPFKTFVTNAVFIASYYNLQKLNTNCNSKLNFKVCRLISSIQNTYDKMLKEDENSTRYLNIKEKQLFSKHLI